ncbi:uncharacterized protein T551_02625 [Pneumocystis jirovecii RU7]|uniref:Translation initiation factor IF-3 n=1 Tax=Pneumocystis jirovecii (strain RU7) TaxID=1408657 RepID=A0A0W4ZIM1_PNEJ7|nr:uncharacterized protein T551_02625 [Pneumocystis jirovecii RU7]KTW28206.1 hypothetical protein T551_02625 [Pneumocystis jirovecii RU7]
MLYQIKSGFNRYINSLRLIKEYILQSFIFFERNNQYKNFYGTNSMKSTDYNGVKSQSDIDSNIAISQSEKSKKCIKVIKKKSNRYTKKIIQINWNITEHDLKHRLRIGMISLEKGYDIDVLIRSRKSKGKFELCKREKMLKNLREIFLQKGIERKPAVGTFNDSYTLYFKPKKYHNIS